MKLQLQTNNPQEEYIKAYLEKNADNVLAEKINKGTPFTKDGKTLINKKTIDGFMDYANKQAREIAEKGKTYAMINEKTVCGWAIHYFGEDSIEEKLYTLDGEEYKSPKPVYKPKTTTTAPTVVKAEPKPQLSLFDMLSENKEETAETTEEENKETLSLKAQMAKYSQPDPLEDYDEEPTQEDIQDAFNSIDNEVFDDTLTVKEEKPKLLGSPVYQNYMKIQNQYPDCIVVYRLGDFYEIFGKNAITIAGELELTLTGRDCGLEERVSMVGYPYHVADKYVSKMIANGHKVAIVENLDDVKIRQKEDPDKLWVNDTTYIDKNDGVVHEVIKESDSSMDSAVVAIWKNLLGDDLAI